MKNEIIELIKELELSRGKDKYKNLKTLEVSKDRFPTDWIIARLNRILENR